jgi:hypothetical protein
MFFRLFGVPALIVGGLVIALIVAQPLIGTFSKFVLGRAWGTASPEQFLHDLDDTNGEVRWRAANDLAQVLLRDDALASDSAFALQLTQRLRKVLDSSAPLEKAHAELVKTRGELSLAEAAAEMKKLEPDRNYILLLAQCLGRFMVPVGAPILEEMAVQESGLDPRALSARRRQALWALANLGENLKRFDKLPPERQEAVQSQLEAVADEQAGLAKSTRDYLTGRQKGHPNALGMDRVIEKCAAAEDPSLRQFAAMAASFWSGTTEESARLEKALSRLCDDPGTGAEALTRLEEENRAEPTRRIVKKPGFDIQVQAAIALARQGWKVRLGLLQTMLDEDELRGIFIVQAKQGGAERPDEAAVVETVLNTLKAVAELHRHRPELDLTSLRPSLDKLAHDPNPAVSTEAGKVVLALSQS